MTSPQPVDFSTVTEVTGNRLTSEAISMMYTRYRFGADLARGGDVLEAACGVGQGLGLLARSARRTVGGDLTDSLTRQASDQYRGRVGVVRLDAQQLPFRGGSFDVVLLFEAVYYLPEAARFLREAGRVLRPAGKLVLCSANPESPEFNPSPHSVRYYRPLEMKALLEEEGYAADLLAAYPARPRGLARRMVSGIRRAAVALGLMPKTMKGKETLKRLFYGRLLEMPRELDDGSFAAPAPVDAGPDGPGPHYKVYFAVASRRG